MISRWIDAALDATVVYSFDAMGYRRHAKRFAPDALDVDMSGRVCLVTGANGGIGKEVARGLALRNARVFMLCRNLERGEQARDELVREGVPGSIRVEQVDVSSLDSVRAFVERFPEERVDVLVHNAGLIPETRELSPDGLELTFATHVAGPFLLSRLLESNLRKAAPGRVIFVSSGGMYTKGLSLEDVNWSEREYGGVAAYAQTKRMQVVLAEQLAERWPPTEIVCHVMHPGWAATAGIQSALPGFSRMMQNRLRTAREGADTVLWLAIAAEPAESTGCFWFDRAPARTHLLPFTHDTPELRKQFWELCERVTTGDAAESTRSSAES